MCVTGTPTPTSTPAPTNVRSLQRRHLAASCAVTATALCPVLGSHTWPRPARQSHEAVPGGLLPVPRPALSHAPLLAAPCVNFRPAEGRLPTIWPGVDCWQPVTAPCEEGPLHRASCQAAWGSAEPAGGMGGDVGVFRPSSSHRRHPEAPASSRPPPPTYSWRNGVACCSPGRCSRPAPAGEAGTLQTVRKAGGQPGSAPCPMPALAPGVLLTAAGLGSRTLLTVHGQTEKQRHPPSGEEEGSEADRSQDGATAAGPSRCVTGTLLLRRKQLFTHSLS